MKFYRYQDNFLQTSPRVDLLEYVLIKETLKGYWIKRDFEKYAFYGGKTRWVSKTARKRFAYPSKEEALENYLSRKKRQVFILSTKVKEAEFLLDVAETKQRRLKNENRITGHKLGVYRCEISSS